MEKITVTKANLLDKLRANRAEHRTIYEEAIAGFVTEVTRELELKIRAINNGERQDIRISRYAPEDHTREYDRTIAMIEMAIGDQIVLSEPDFAQYVMDDWGWQGGFLSNTYGSKAAIEKFSNR